MAGKGVQSLQPIEIMESNSSPVERAASLVTNIFLAAVVLLYFGFVGIGNWAADEYDDFGRLARDGWHEVWRRLQWSPRPFSEPLFLAYGWAVNQLHRSLIVPFLLLLWAMFFAAGLFTYWRERRTHAGADLQLSLALMASFVSGGAVAEVFYWPAGAVECLPTVAAALLLFLQTVHGGLSTVEGRRVASLCLLMAACSSEMGAGFVLVYAAFQLLGRVSGERNQSHTESRQSVLWWIAPALIAMLVLLALMTYRLRLKEQPIEHAPVALGISLVSVGARAVASEMFGVVVRSDGRVAINSRLLSEVLVAFGIVLCWSRMQKSSRQVSRETALLSAALLLSSILTIAASELQFHAVCCQRHETVRRCWILLGFAGLAIAVAGMRWKESLRPRTGAWLASLLLCAGIVVAWHTRPVLREYRLYGSIYHALDNNFRSGFTAGEDPMTFLLIPPGGIIYQQQVPSGTYKVDDAPPYVRYVLRFFNKRTMIVRSPEQWMNSDQPEK